MVCMAVTIGCQQRKDDMNTDHSASRNGIIDGQIVGGGQSAGRGNGLVVPDYATPKGGYPFGVTTELPPKALPADWTGTETNTIGQNPATDVNTQWRAKDFTLDIGAIGGSGSPAFFASGYHHWENVTIDVDPGATLGHGIRLVGCERALLDNVDIISRQWTGGQSIKITTNWNGPDESSDLVIQNFTANNWCLIGLVNEDEVDYGQIERVVLDNGVITVADVGQNIGLKLKAPKDIYLRDVTIDMSARSLWCCGLQIENGVAPSTYVAQNIYCTRVKVYVSQASMDAGAQAIRYWFGATSAALAAAPYDDITIEVKP
jgi:hypothetical protein